MRHGEFGGSPHLALRVIMCWDAVPASQEGWVLWWQNWQGWAQDANCQEVSGSVLGLSVCLPQVCKPPGRGDGRKYLNTWGGNSSWEPFSLLFLRPSALLPPPSLLSLTHSFIQQKFRLSPLGPALGWAMPGTGDDSNWCLPLGCSRAGEEGGMVNKPQELILDLRSSRQVDR